MKILVIGATSAIAKSVIRKYAEQKHTLHLIGRNAEALDTIAKDATVRGADKATFEALDLTDFSKFPAMIETAHKTLDTFDVVLIAHGTLPVQEDCIADWDEARKALKINGISVLALLTPIANIMEQQKSGVIAVISSVAGDRGRQSNYVYGTAKAMVTTFLQGLRNRLAKSGVHVITIKPGFVDTPMTANLKKGALFASSDKVAKDIIKGIKKKKDILYTPKIWWVIMTIIKNIPERIFKKLSL